MTQDVANAVSFQNTIRGDDTVAAITKTLKDAVRILRPSSGPNALYMATAVRGTSFQGAEYTKDGITIIKRAHVKTAIETFIRQELIFLGEAVDRCCHDGTTTAMLTFSALTSEYMSLLKDLDRRERRQISNEMEQYLSRMIDHISNMKLTVSSLTKLLQQTHPHITEDDVKERIAYWTALTSTKGDKLYAEAITESVMSYPEELYDYGRIGTMHVESEDHVKVASAGGETSDGADIALYAVPSIQGLLAGNDDLGLDWSYEDAEAVFYHTDLVEGDDLSNFLAMMIHSQLFPESYEDESKPKFPKLTKPLFIFSPNLRHTGIIGLIKEYNNRPENKDKPIIPWNFLDYPKEALYCVVQGIAAMCDKGDFVDLEGLHREARQAADILIPVKIRTVGQRQILLYNLYKKDGTRYHPFYKDESRTNYHRVVKALREFVKGDAVRHKRHDDNTMDKFNYILRMMIGQGVKDVYAAGSTHNVLAGRSVLEDALGATLSVLSRGFVLSGYVQFYLVLNDLALKNKEQNPQGEDYVDRIVDATRKALELVLSATYEIPENDVRDTLYEKVINQSIDKDTLPLTSFNEDLYKVIEKQSILEALVDDNWKEKLIVTQPVRGYEEQLIRIKDIVMRLIRTDVVVLAEG